jgi:hypothetical protein
LPALSWLSSRFPGQKIGHSTPSAVQGCETSSEHVAGLESFCRAKKYNAPFGLLITQQESGPIGDNVVAVPAAALLSVL